MREIRIIIDDQGALEVFEGTTTTGILCWGEMLEQIAAMTIPEKKVSAMGGKIYPMLTPEQWAARDEAMALKLKQLREEEES